MLVYQRVTSIGDGLLLYLPHEVSYAAVMYLRYLRLQCETWAAGAATSAQAQQLHSGSSV